MASRRKSTDMVKRRAKMRSDAELEEKSLSPQEQRRQMLLNIGVWFLVLAFCMTSGIMCFSVGGQEKLMKAQEEAQQKDPTQAEIERWSGEVEQNPNDPVALANLGYYWGQKAQELEKTAAKPKKDDDKDKKDGKPAITREQALQNAHGYLDRALQADPNYAFALQKYAELYIYEKNNAKARELLERVVVACEKPVPEGDDKEALEANALNQKGQAVIALALLDAKDDKNSEAISRLNALLKEQPGNMQAFLAKGNIISSQKGGDKQEALKSYGEALKIAKSLGDAETAFRCWTIRAAVYKEMGSKEAAKKELQAAKEFFAGNPMMSAMLDNMINQIDGVKPGTGKDAKTTGAAVKKAENKAEAKPSPAASAAPAAAPAEGTASPEPKPADVSTAKKSASDKLEENNNNNQIDDNKTENVSDQAKRTVPDKICVSAGIGDTLEDWIKEYGEPTVNEPGVATVFSCGEGTLNVSFLDNRADNILISDKVGEQTIVSLCPKDGKFLTERKKTMQEYYKVTKSYTSESIKNTIKGNGKGLYRVSISYDTKTNKFLNACIDCSGVVPIDEEE